MVFAEILMAVLISNAKWADSNEGIVPDQFRIMSGQRFKNMLVNRDTQCFKDWISNANVRCVHKDSPSYRSLASQLVVCEAKRNGRTIRNCSDEMANWKACYGTLTDDDIDNYSAFYPEIAAYCAYVKFDGKSVPEATLSEFVGGVMEVRTKLNDALREFPLTKIAVSQVILLPDARTEFKRGQLPFYMLIFSIWIMCKSFLHSGCEKYIVQVLIVALVEFCIAALYFTTIGLALVILFGIEFKL